MHILRPMSQEEIDYMLPTLQVVNTSSVKFIKDEGIGMGLKLHNDEDYETAQCILYHYRDMLREIKKKEE
jgi:hypothetical protein